MVNIGDRYPSGRKRQSQEPDTQRHHARRERLKAAELCAQCGKEPPLPGLSTGAACRERIAAYYQQNKARARELGRNWAARTKRKVLDHYGGVCQCCGEGQEEFLAFDHINGGGSAHRKQYPGSLWLWLWKHRLPEGFQVLCHNCNMAKGFFGVCPHQQ